MSPITQRTSHPQIFLVGVEIEEPGKQHLAIGKCLLNVDAKMRAALGEFVAACEKEQWSCENRIGAHVEMNQS